jgi:hypothetical protein
MLAGAAVHARLATSAPIWMIPNEDQAVVQANQVKLWLLLTVKSYPGPPNP